MRTIHGTLVDVMARQIYGAEIAVEAGKIATIRRTSHEGPPYILPGFIDSHIHIESSMLIPSQFASMAIRHGTVAVVADPHEVANVAGEEGIQFMIHDAKRSPLKFFYGVPSCVPASPIEKSGAQLGPQSVNRMLSSSDFHFLAEMMNFPGVVQGDSLVMEKLRAAQENHKPIDGHAPGLTGDALKKYVEAGITTDHECSTLDEALEKIAKGMKILIREGSAARNFETLAPLIDRHPAEVMLCTDDCHPDYLMQWHINRLVARAVKKGTNLFNAVKAATINPIHHYNLPVGQLRTNDPADFVLVDNLIEFNVIATFINGQEVWRNGQEPFSQTIAPTAFPSFRFRRTPLRNSISISAKTSRMNGIQAFDGDLVTKILEVDGLSPGNEVKTRPHEDLLKIVLLDRYADDPPVVAFIKGFNLKEGAIAGSIAHDSHHLMAIGVEDMPIEEALNWIINSKGGLCYANGDGKVQGIALPFFGLMSNEQPADLAKRYQQLNQLVKLKGSTLQAPFMTMAFMALTVIPEIKIYHKGLFNSQIFKHINQFI